MKVSVKPLRNPEVVAGSSKGSFPPRRTIEVFPSQYLPETSKPQMPKHVARVVVSQRAFCAWWLAVIAIHCCCGVFLGYVGGLYLYLLDSEVIFDMAIYSVTINTAYFPTVATMYFALASIHGLLVLFILTYQAYRLSCLVPRRWMNNAMVGALVLNCWATPLLQYRFRKNVGHVRLGGALVNMVLDMVSYIGMPVALFWPYAGQFYTDRKQFDRIYYYSDVWLIEAINEAQMIFVSSLYDAISKCLIALSVARGLYSITKLICVADPVKPTQVVSTRGGCSLLEFNCAEERATGTASEIDLLLQVFNPDRVEYLMIRHCPLLIFPKRIQTLHELLGLKVFNSTIQEWGEDAAVTSTHHPELRFVFLVDVKMREFPIGLQHADFPKTLRDIEFSRTNVTVIPDTLDTIWPTGMYIAFEECQLQEFPSVVLRVQPSDLALALNNFSSLPPEVFQGFPLRVFSVAGSPLHSLPSTLSEPPQIMWYGLIQTEISELPVWMDDAFLASTFIVASKTPLCDSLIAAGEKSEVDSSALVGIPGLDCSLTFMGNSSLNWYPIDIETTINPSYSLS